MASASRRWLALVCGLLNEGEDESIDVCSSCPTRAVRVVYEPDYVGGGGSGQGRQLVGSPEVTGR
uniref:Uncharacterized protein n=1 Tax=Oryza sativa subsp. japonica TaxID=39947 RepID=Q69LU3_ORYSJ|nr:hypothetical protein [Oryza sativa Japonica Group]